MASIREAVKRSAISANLDVSEEELDIYVQRIKDIIGTMDELRGISTENTEPTVNVLSAQNIFREDTVWEGLSRDSALKNAPCVEDGQFRVPKIV